MSDLVPQYQVMNTLEDRGVANQARTMFYEGILPTDIAETLQIDFSELKVKVFGKDGKGTDPRCWYSLREKRELAQTDPSVPAWEKVDYYYVKQTEARLFRLIEKSLKEMEDSEHTLEDIDGIKKAIDSWGSVNKMRLLKEGKPTEHIQIGHGMTLSEIEEKYKGQVVIEVKE